MYILFSYNACECDMCGHSGGGATDADFVFDNPEDLLAYVKRCINSTYEYNVLLIEDGKVYEISIYENPLRLSEYRNQVTRWIP